MRRCTSGGVGPARSGNLSTVSGKELDSQRGSMVAHHVKGNRAIQMMKLGQQPMTKDLIAQHDLTDDEYDTI